MCSVCSNLFQSFHTGHWLCPRCEWTKTRRVVSLGIPRDASDRLAEALTQCHYVAGRRNQTNTSGWLPAPSLSFPYTPWRVRNLRIHLNWSLPFILGVAAEGKWQSDGLLLRGLRFNTSGVSLPLPEVTKSQCYSDDLFLRVVSFFRMIKRHWISTSDV